MVASAWHIVTCEYPPRTGGVADFSAAIAKGLSDRGEVVHVWSPAPATGGDGAVVHALPSAYRAGALADLDRAMNAASVRRRLFVQWVPHGYGYKSLNVPFCFWLRRRARQGDAVELLIHEPFLPFDAGRVRQNVGAMVHRAMLAILLRAADRVWVSTPSFIDDVSRFAPRGLPKPSWLPIPSPVLPVCEPEAVARQRRVVAGDAPLVGHFGTCGKLIEPMLAEVIALVASACPQAKFALLGRGTDEFCRRLVARRPSLADAIVVCGQRALRDLSVLLQACDLFVQPYPDGVSARRTTLMALLAHGRPVITTSGPRTEPWWRDAQAVQLTPGGDPAAMAEAAQRLTIDAAQREIMGAHALALYAAQFDVGHAVQALLEGCGRPASHAVTCA